VYKVKEKVKHHLLLHSQRLLDFLLNLIQQLNQIGHLQRIRIHSRLPIVLPARITDELLAILANSGKTIIMVVHCNHANELNPRVTSAIKLLSPDDLLIDIIYDQPSEIYFEAIRLGLNCLDGMPMLIEQARLSQFLWWKKSASYDDMLFAIKNSGWPHR
jgi:hypothetical protein